MPRNSKQRPAKSKGASITAIPSLSLDELIRQQGVKPVTDFDALSSLWPPEHDPEAFDRFVREERATRRSSKPRRKTA